MQVKKSVVVRGSSSLDARSGGSRSTLRDTSNFGDYSAAGEFEIWGEAEHSYRLANGLVEPAGNGHPGPPNAAAVAGLQQQQQQQRGEPGSVSSRAMTASPQHMSREIGGNTGSLRPLMHIAHCELHSPRDAELLRLDQLDSYEQQQHKIGESGTGDRDTYAMMDNYHNSPVPPPLPRRHVSHSLGHLMMQQSHY
ncbi:hypothetical protein QAD02_011874, partial [Eretmocerus hayati]